MRRKVLTFRAEINYNKSYMKRVSSEMKKKRLIRMLFTAFILALVAAVSSACYAYEEEEDDPTEQNQGQNTPTDEDKHVHTFGSWTIVREPGCLTSGLRRRYCIADDGEMEEEEIPELGHDGVIVPAVPATCTEDGLSEGEVCGVCGERLHAMRRRSRRSRRDDVRAFARRHVRIGEIHRDGGAADAQFDL